MYWQVGIFIVVNQVVANKIFKYFNPAVVTGCWFLVTGCWFFVILSGVEGIFNKNHWINLCQPFAQQGIVYYNCFEGFGVGFCNLCVSFFNYIFVELFTCREIKRCYKPVQLFGFFSFHVIAKMCIGKNKLTEGKAFKFWFWREEAPFACGISPEGGTKRKKPPPLRSSPKGGL